MDDLETNRQTVAELTPGHQGRKWMKRDHPHPHHHHRRHHHHHHGHHRHPDMPYPMGKPGELLWCPLSKRFNDLDNPGHQRGPHHHWPHHHQKWGGFPRPEIWYYYMEEMNKGGFVQKPHKRDKCRREKSAPERMAEIRKRMSWLNLASPPPPKQKEPVEEPGTSKE